jgi:hypothetical protein
MRFSTLERHSDETQCFFFSVQSCEECVWVEHENTQVVQTSWAAMALMYGKYPYAGPIAKAAKLVMSRQLPVRGLVPAPLLSLVTVMTSYISLISRTARGHKRRLKGSSVGLARFHIRTSSLRLLYGCLRRHRNTWKSAELFRCRVASTSLALLKPIPEDVTSGRCPR